MGDAWGGDVSAYRREGEVELGPTTWLYFDSGVAPQRFGTKRHGDYRFSPGYGQSVWQRNVRNLVCRFN